MTSEKIEKNLIVREDRLKTLIEESKEYILSLPDNWDGYGADIIDYDSLERAINLLQRLLKNLWKEMFEVPLPRIQPVPDGSIDLNWKTEKFELLINIPSINDNTVCAYGEHIGHPEDLLDHKGKIDGIDLILNTWLKKVL